jgi:hypothetical protein
MAAAFVRWLMFHVAAALCPLGAHALFLTTKSAEVSLPAIFGEGELLLLSTVVSATGLGELVGRGGRFQVPRVIVGGVNVILIIMACLYFASISVEQSSADQHAAKVAHYSLLMFLCAVVCGGFSVSIGAVSELDR